MNNAVANLSPGYFALVMATGILSGALLGIALVAYVTLWALYIWRVVQFRSHVLRDMRDPEKVFAYFTVVAGTDVLAVRLLQADLPGLAMLLVFFGAIVWFVFGYILPWQVLMTRDGKPILARTNGTWFIWAVASQSLAIGMSRISPFFNDGAPWVGLVAVLS